MATNDFQSFAGDPAANVMPLSSYTDPGFTARILGFSSGTALSVQLNRVWRQASLISHMIGQFTVDQANQDMLDDGTPAGLTALETHFTSAIRNVALAAIGVGYLPLTGGSLTGNLTVNAPQISINAPTAQNAALYLSRQAGHFGLLQGLTGVTSRWQLQYPNADPEQGANSGSNISVVSFTDAGAVLDTPMTINRATSVVNFSRSPTVNGTNLPYVRMTGDVMTGPLGVGGQGISYNGLGGIWAAHRLAFGWDGTLVQMAVDGTGIGGIATTGYVAGVAGNYVAKTGDTMTGGLTINNGGLVAAGNSGFGSTVYFSGLGDFLNFYGNSRWRYRQWAGNWYDFWDGQTGVRGWYQNGPGMSLDASANLSHTGTHSAYGGRILSISGAFAPSVVAYWTGGVATGFWTDGQGMWLGNVDGAGNPATAHMLIDNNGYLTLWGSAHLAGSLQADSSISAALDLYANRNASIAGTLYAGYVVASQNVNAGNAVSSGGDISAGGQVWANGGAVIAQNGYVYANNAQGGPIMGTLGVVYRQVDGGNWFSFRWDGSKVYVHINVSSYYNLIYGDIGNYRFNKPGMQGGQAYFHDSDDSTWYLNTFRSDARLKRNIRHAEMFDSLGAIIRTPIRSFEWIDEDIPPVTNGFVSADLRDTLPDTVRALDGGADLGDIDHVDVLPLIAHAFRAIRQLNERIDAMGAGHV